MKSYISCRFIKGTLNLFTDYESRGADEALCNSEPKAYRQIHGVVLVLGQSLLKGVFLKLCDHFALGAPLHFKPDEPQNYLEACG